MFKRKNTTDTPTVHKAKSWPSDIFGIIIFVIIVAVGVFVLNVAVFRSYSVTGASMEPTFYTNDRIIVNRMPVTWAALQGQDYLPQRGQIIVFENPQFVSGVGMSDQYIVKRVIAFPGERVTIKDCNLRVHNNQHPDGFNPYDDFDIKPDCVSGTNDTIVPERQLYVVGDHRNGQHSMDSRNHLGTVGLEYVIGPVGVQILPLDKFRFF